MTKKKKKKIDLNKVLQAERERLAKMPLIERQKELYRRDVAGKVRIENKADRLSKFVAPATAERWLSEGRISGTQKTGYYER